MRGGDVWGGKESSSRAIQASGADETPHKNRETRGAEKGKRDGKCVRSLSQPVHYSPPRISA